MEKRMSVDRMRRVGAKGEDDMGEKRNRLGIEDLVRLESDQTH